MPSIERIAALRVEYHGQKYKRANASERAS